MNQTEPSSPPSSSQIRGNRIFIAASLDGWALPLARRFSGSNEVMLYSPDRGIDPDRQRAVLTQIGAVSRDLNFNRLPEVHASLSGFSPEIIINVGPDPARLELESSLKDAQNALRRTLFLCEICRSLHRRPILLHINSSSAHDDTPRGHILRAAEMYAREFQKKHDLPAVFLSHACVYGPNLFRPDDETDLGWLALRIAAGLDVELNGNSASRIEPLFIDDILDAYERAILDANKLRGRSFHLHGPRSLTFRELTDILTHTINAGTQPDLSATQSPGSAQNRTDIPEAPPLAGWAPRMGLSEGLSKLAGWARAEGPALTRRVSSQRSQDSQEYDATVVLPAHNEAENIELVLNELQFILQFRLYRVQVIVVDDASTDKTAELARRYPFVQVISNHHARGKGGALRSGFDIAKGTYIAMMDSDYSHNPADLPAMIEEVERHQGLVVGSRITGGSEEYTRVRAFGNIVLTLCFGLFHNRYLSDALNGFKIFHRDIFNSFDYSADGFEIEIELLANTLRLGRQVTEVPCRERQRLKGEMKSSVVRDGCRFLHRIIWERFRRPKRKPVGVPA